MVPNFLLGSYVIDLIPLSFVVIYLINGMIEITEGSNVDGVKKNEKKDLRFSNKS